MKVHDDGIIRNRCPICGGHIIVSEYIQIARDYKVSKSGKVSKKYTVSVGDGGDYPMTASCSEQCGAYWEDGQFYIAEDGTFHDLIYKED